jgi:hypothetical protein
MTAAAADADLQQHVVRELVAAARLARAELQGWMKHYGHDLDSAEAIVALDAAIKKAGLK